MAIEIERKFLLKKGCPLPESNQIYHIRQCYLNRDEEMSIRTRLVKGVGSFITIKKSVAENLSMRTEFEYEIPEEEALQLMGLSHTIPIAKQRHSLSFDGVTWEIDFFEDENEGLIIAEIELNSIDQAILIPEWIGKEVSDDPKYLNHALALRPYTTWSEEEKNNGSI